MIQIHLNSLFSFWPHYSNFKFQVSFSSFCLVLFGNYGDFMLNDCRKCVRLGLSGDFNYTRHFCEYPKWLHAVPNAVKRANNTCQFQWFVRMIQNQKASTLHTKKSSPGSFIFEWHHLVIGGTTPNAFVCFVVHSSIARTPSRTHTAHRATTATSFNWLKLCLFLVCVFFALVWCVHKFLSSIVVPFLTHTYGTVDGIFWSNEWENERWSVHAKRKKAQ